MKQLRRADNPSSGRLSDDGATMTDARRRMIYRYGYTEEPEHEEVDESDGATVLVAEPPPPERELDPEPEVEVEPAPPPEPRAEPEADGRRRGRPRGTRKRRQVHFHVDPDEDRLLLRAAGRHGSQQKALVAALQALDEVLALRDQVAMLEAECSRQRRLLAEAQALFRSS